MDSTALNDRQKAFFLYANTLTDAEFEQIVRSGSDPHKALVAKCLNKTAEDVTVEERRDMKAAAFMRRYLPRRQHRTADMFRTSFEWDLCVKLLDMPYEERDAEEGISARATVLAGMNVNNRQQFMTMHPEELLGHLAEMLLHSAVVQRNLGIENNPFTWTDKELSDLEDETKRLVASFKQHAKRIVTDARESAAFGQVQRQKEAEKK